MQSMWCKTKLCTIILVLLPSLLACKGSSREDIIKYNQKLVRNEKVVISPFKTTLTILADWNNIYNRIQNSALIPEEKIKQLEKSVKDLEDNLEFAIRSFKKGIEYVERTSPPSEAIRIKEAYLKYFNCLLKIANQIKTKLSNLKDYAKIGNIYPTVEPNINKCSQDLQKAQKSVFKKYNIPYMR